MEKKQKEKEVITVSYRITPQIKRYFDIICAERGINKSECFVKLVMEERERRKNKQKP